MGYCNLLSKTDFPLINSSRRATYSWAPINFQHGFFIPLVLAPISDGQEIRENHFCMRPDLHDRREKKKNPNWVMLWCRGILAGLHVIVLLNCFEHLLKWPLTSSARWCCCQTCVRINMGQAGSSLQMYLVLVWSNRGGERRLRETWCRGRRKDCESTVWSHYWKMIRHS